MNKFTYVTVLLLLSCFSISPQINAQKLTPLQKAESFLNSKEEVYFSFKINNKEEIKSYTQEFSLVNYDPNSKTLVAWANRQQFEAFLEKGIPFNVDGLENEPTERLMSNQLINDGVGNNFRATPLSFPLTAYPTYQDYADQMALFATNNSSICQLVDIGGTTESVGGGNKRLLFIKLSDNVSVQEQEPRIMYTSSMHGDEIAGYPLMLDLINYFIIAYNDTGHSDHTRVKNLIDNSEIWINPSANPDGTYYNDPTNTSVATARRANDNNIDLNRNYPDNIIGPHANGHTAYELETQHFMTFADTYKFVLSANFHGGTEVVNYAWDNTSTLHADDAWLFDVSKEYAVNCQNDAFSYNGDTNYMDAEYTNFVWPGVTNGNDWYEVYGGRQDFMNFYELCKETTLELSNVKTPPASELVNLWNWNREALIDYLVQGTYGFTGVVKDASTNNPVEATITLVGHDISNSHTTSESTFGDYYRPVKAGTYNILFEAPCYQSFTLTNQTIADYQKIVLSPVLLTPGAEIPSSINPSGVNPTSATVSWGAQTGNTFDLRYRETGSPTWTDITNQSTNSYNITGLTILTEYEVQVRSKCDSFTSNYSSSITFTTPSISYCNSSGNTITNTGVTYVSFNTITNADTNKNIGYEDFTGQSTNVGKGDSHNLTVRVNTAGNRRVHAFAWFDWNQDGDFNDTGESIDLGDVKNVTDGSPNLSPVSITIPASASFGSTRMRISTKFNANPIACEPSTFDGEVEDYSINIVPPPAPPTAVCQDITVQLDATGSVTILPGDVDGGSSGDGSITLSLDIDTFTCSDIGDNIVTLTVDDPANPPAANCNATVTVKNKVPVPTVADLPDLTDLCSVTPTAPTATDCIGTITGLPNTTFPITVQGTTVVTWTYTRAVPFAFSQQTQNVTITDSEDPTITCAGPINVNTDAGTCTYDSTQLTAPSGADNCSVASVVASPASLVLGANTVTWTVTDDAGLTATCEQTVTVVDNLDPTITCPTDVSVNVDAGLCTASSVDLGTAPTGADNCSVASVTNDAPTTYPLGDTTVTWTVTDGAGLTATCEQTVTVVDNLDPTITCPTDVSVNVDAGLCTASSVDLGTAPTGADNCSVASVTNDAPTTYPLGDTTVTWTVTDGAGLTATCEQTVTVVDNIDPTITCPTDVSVNVDAGLCTASSVDLGTAPTGADNCSVASVTNDAPTTYPLGDTTVTWTVTDDAGLTATCEQTVTVVDNIDPTITCPTDVSVNVDAGLCTASSVDLGTAPTGADNCSVASVTNDAPTTYPLGDTTVTWTVTDDAGLTATCEQTVTVVDNIDPTITCPTDVSVNVDAGLCTASSVDLGTAPTGADNCSVASVTNDAPTTYPLGDTTVTWTVTDGAGLTATCEQTVTVVDNIDPTITCPTDVSVNVDAGLCTANSVDLGTAPTGADNCSVASVTNDAPTTYPLGDTTVTWTVTDGAGLTATCEQTVTVVDNIDPTITCPTDVSVNVDAGLCTASSVDLGTAPTGADNCSVASVTNDAPTTYPLGDTTVTWTVTDGAGLTATCEQTVTVVDNIDPTITCPTNVSVNVDAGLCTASSVDLGTAPTGADNCSVASVTNDAPTTYPLGDTTVTWTVTDGAGLTATCEQTVTVVDNIDPTITCPTDVSVNVDAGLCTASSVDLGTAPTGADNCSVASVTNDAPTTYPLGDTTVTWTVTDGAGLTATCEQTVTVVDNIDPTITCPTDVSVNVDAGLCTASSVDLGTAPTGADNCSVASVTNDAPTTYPLGDTTVTWTVTDGAGLTATCEQTVTVVDNIDPTITCPTDVSVNVDAGLCTASSVDLGTAPTGADNCSVASVTNDAPTTYPLGDTTVTWTVTDGAGLTATCEQTVTVVDNIDPTITCPTDVSVNVDAGLCTASSVDLGTAPTGADNCSVASVTNDAPTTYPLGDTTVTWTVTDGAGLTATCEQTVTVVDNIDPTITCPTDVSVNVDAGLCTASSVDLGTAPTGADNCSVASVTNDAPTTYPLGDTTVTWTVTDGAGLTATCEQTVTVVDNIDPVCVAQDITIDLLGGTIVITGTDIDNGSSDNCSIASLVASPNTFDGTALGDNVVTLTVTDSAGNSLNCNVTVTVEDSTLSNQEFEEIEGVNVYPNPFNEELNIKLPPSYYGKTINIDLMDIRGRLVKSLKKEYLNSVLTIEEFGDFEDGSYFIKITNNLEKILFKQLIKK